MTTQNKATLTSLFEQGDIPNGTNFADLIDSYVNVAETSVQTMQGALNPTEIITPRVSATNGVFTGTLRIAGITSAGTVNMVTASATNLHAVSANIGHVQASTARIPVIYGTVGIVSAAGSTQATAAPLVYTINRGAGVADGETTGFILPSNLTGSQQTVINGGASANLWPCVGGRINALASNAAFGMAANTTYIIFHTEASGYAVK